MANRWGNNENSDRFYFLSREIKRHVLLGRKAMTNLDSILKSRDIPLPTVNYKLALTKSTAND